MVKSWDSYILESFDRRGICKFRAGKPFAVNKKSRHANRIGICFREMHFENYLRSVILLVFTNLSLPLITVAIIR